MGGLNQRRVCLLLTQITNVKLRREGREGKKDEGQGTIQQIGLFHITLYLG